MALVIRHCRGRLLDLGALLQVAASQLALNAAYLDSRVDDFHFRALLGLAQDQLHQNQVDEVVSLPFQHFH